MVRKVKLGDASVTAVAYGCMGLSQAYEPCAEAQAIKTLNAVLDMGYDHLDTAALYGFGKNEELLNNNLFRLRKRSRGLGGSDDQMGAIFRLRRSNDPMGLGATFRL